MFACLMAGVTQLFARLGTSFSHANFFVVRNNLRACPSYLYFLYKYVFAVCTFSVNRLLRQSISHWQLTSRFFQWFWFLSDYGTGIFCQHITFLPMVLVPFRLRYRYFLPASLCRLRSNMLELPRVEFVSAFFLMAVGLDAVFSRLTSQAFTCFLLLERPSLKRHTDFFFFQPFLESADLPAKATLVSF
jgi:hypothetical protein